MSGLSVGTSKSCFWTTTRALVEVLLAHRTLPATVLVAAMDRAVHSGCLDPQVVLIDAGSALPCFSLCRALFGKSAHPAARTRATTGEPMTGVSLKSARTSGLGQPDPSLVSA